MSAYGIRLTVRRIAAALLGATACLCAGLVWGEPQIVLQSYDDWYAASVMALVSEGALTSAQADALVQTTLNRPDRAIAAQAADAAGAVAALKRQAELDLQRLGNLRARAARDREWVLAEMQQLGQTVPEALAARKYVTSDERDGFSLGLPVEWAVAQTPVPAPGPWVPPATGATPTASPRPTGAGGSPETASGRPAAQLPVDMPYDPSEFWAFYATWHGQGGTQ